VKGANKCEGRLQQEKTENMGIRRKSFSAFFAPFSYLRDLHCENAFYLDWQRQQFCVCPGGGGAGEGDGAEVGGREITSKAGVGLAVGPGDRPTGKSSYREIVASVRLSVIVPRFSALPVTNRLPRAAMLMASSHSSARSRPVVEDITGFLREHWLNATP